MQSLSQLVGPFLFTLTFAYFIGARAPVELPGAPFLLASVLLVLALLIAAVSSEGLDTLTTPALATCAPSRMIAASHLTNTTITASG